jgi:hypothetical protein
MHLIGEYATVSMCPAEATDLYRHLRFGDCAANEPRCISEPACAIEDENDRYSRARSRLRLCYGIVRDTAQPRRRRKRILRKGGSIRTKYAVARGPQKSCHRPAQASTSRHGRSLSSARPCMCPFGQWERQLPMKVPFSFLQPRLRPNRVGFLGVIARILPTICFSFFFLSFLNRSEWALSNGRTCRAVLK